MRGWYKFENTAPAEPAPTTATLLIYDEIGPSFFNDEAVRASQLVADLAALPDSVRALIVRINSPGGDVFEGVTVANVLRAQRTDKGRSVEVIVDGLAASAATLPMMAADRIKVADNAAVLIHNPFVIVAGDAADLRKTAEHLDSIRDVMIATYRWHSPLSETAISALLDDETLMDADAAIANGFAHEKIAGLQPVAAFDRRVLARVPERFRNRVAAFVRQPEPERLPAPPAPEPERPPVPPAVNAAALVRLCAAAKCLDLVEGLVADNVSEAVAQQRIEHASAIRGLCATAKLPELAAGYISSRARIEDVRAHLVIVTARLDAACGNIDGSLLPDVGARKPCPEGLRLANVYGKRNQEGGMAR
jgi:ATP-dependent protease ClpP protease subunit